LNLNSDPNIERPLPHSLEAERAVLGSILLGSPDANDALARLQSTDFLLRSNQVIFRHLKQLREHGKPTNDTVLLYESLDACNELDSVGGIAYLTQIPDGLPRLNHIAHYVEIIKLKAQLRESVHIAETIREKLLSGNGKAQDVLRDVAILSARLREEVGQERVLNFRSGAEIAMATDQVIHWLLPGLAAKGAITELGAKVKVGKTTLIMKLVRAVAEGLDFLGMPTIKTPTVYLTEQPMVSFRQAMERADLLGRDDFHVLLHSDTRGMPWAEVAAAAIEECGHSGASLLVVDTLPQFAGLKGDSENNSGDALGAMEPLLRAAEKGIGVILARHERKSGGDVGDSGRGSSAFAGAVDIVLSLRRPEGNSKKTLRVLQALSRFSETPPELLIELTDSGYVSLGEPHEAAVKEAKESILAIVPRSETEAVDLKEIIEGAKVPRVTAQRAVKELAEAGGLNRVGLGKRGSPYRYFLLENRFSPTSNIEGQKENVKEANQEVSD
jgi:hypothetical protein